MVTTPTAEQYQQALLRQQVLQDEIEDLKVTIEWYKEQWELAQRKRFGPSSEQSVGQEVFVFNEAEEAADPKLPEVTIDVPAHKRRTRGQRQDALEGLEVEEIHYDLKGDDLTCDTCQSELHKVGSEDRDEIEITPPQVKLIRHCRSKYCCQNCHSDGKHVVFRTATMPPPAFPGSLASPSAVSFIVNQKFVMGSPLYRLEQNFKNMGFGLLSRQTMANWMIRGAKNLDPLHERMKKLLSGLDIVHADETTMQVLHEPGRKAQSKSYMWLYMSGKSGPPIIVYDYQQTRSADHPKKFLAEFKGVLHVDGYAGYDKLANVTLAACWAHVRRKFVDAVALLEPEVKAKGQTKAQRGLDFCNCLFAVEHKIRDRISNRKADDERTDAQIAQEERDTNSAPVLEAFKQWLNEQAANTVMSLKFGEAVKYTLNQWSKLIVFMQDGRLEIDNNRAERAIKPFVIGRKNWLFANTPRGARSSAVLYSIVETAKQNDLDPFKYLTHVFATLPTIDTSDNDALDALMPWSEKMQEQFNGQRKG